MFLKLGAKGNDQLDERESSKSPSLLRYGKEFKKTIINRTRN